MDKIEWLRNLIKSYLRDVKDEPEILVIQGLVQVTRIEAETLFFDLIEFAVLEKTAH